MSKQVEQLQIFFEHQGTDTVIECPNCNSNHPAKLIDAWWSGWSRYSEDVAANCPTCCECEKCFIAAECGEPSGHYPPQ